MEIDNSKLLLEYMMENGFDPKNYKNILELFQSPKYSLSKYLKQQKQLLLMDNVNYEEAKKYGINVCDGYMERTYLNLNCDENIRLKDFDVIISNITNLDNIFEIPYLLKLKQELYIGSCFDLSDMNDLYYNELLSRYFMVLKGQNGKKIKCFIHENEDKKGYFLIKKL